MSFRATLTKEEDKMVKAWVDEHLDYYDLPQELMWKMYDYFADSMPYGVAKARTGDPDVWLFNRIEPEYSEASLSESLGVFNSTTFSPEEKEEMLAYVAGRKDLSKELFGKLYDYYFDEMPYGTKKARDGDPYEWILYRLEDEMDLQEDAPKGWHGTVRAMYTKHPDKFQEPGEKEKAGEINPWALAHSMKKKGYKPHFKDQPTSLKGTPKPKKESVDPTDALLKMVLTEGVEDWDEPWEINAADYSAARHEDLMDQAVAALVDYLKWHYKKHGMKYTHDELSEEFFDIMQDWTDNYISYDLHDLDQGDIHYIIRDALEEVEDLYTEDKDFALNTEAVLEDALNTNPGQHTYEVFYGGKGLISTTNARKAADVAMKAYFDKNWPPFKTKMKRQGKTEVFIYDTQSHELITKDGWNQLMDAADPEPISEAGKAGKTEHSGAKKGKGAYWGPKQDAKKESKKKRRAEDKKTVNEDMKAIYSVAGSPAAVVDEQASSDKLRPGTSVKVPFGGKMVTGKIVRWDDGGSDTQRQHGGGYVVSVDVQPHRSIIVPSHKVSQSVSEAYYGGKLRHGRPRYGKPVNPYDWGRDTKLFKVKSPSQIERLMQDKLDPAFVSDEELKKNANLFYMAFAHQEVPYWYLELGPKRFLQQPEAIKRLKKEGKLNEDIRRFPYGKIPSVNELDHHMDYEPYDMTLKTADDLPDDFAASGADELAFDYAMAMAGTSGNTRNGQELRETLIALVNAPEPGVLSHNEYESVDTILSQWDKEYGPDVSIDEHAFYLASAILRTLGVQWV